MNNIIPFENAKVTAVSLEIADGLSFEQWSKIGETLQFMERSVHFWIGDWLKYGERKYGETYAQAVEATGYETDTLRADKWVAERVETVRRRTVLSWSHHREVAALEPIEQDELLDMAEENNWTRNELRSQVFQHKRNKTRGPVSTEVAQNLHNVDCLTFMKSMPDKSVDMVFTSPPFKEEDVDGDYWQLYDQWMTEIMRVTSKVVIIIHSATKLNQIVLGYPPKRTMVWGKGISKYSWRWNPIFVYQISDDYKVNPHIWSDAFGVESVNGEWKVHKYQDPEILYETIINMFYDCTSVLDPFMGSGTTGKVCRKLGKDFIGCEIDPENYRVASEEINGVAA